MLIFYLDMSSEITCFGFCYLNWSWWNPPYCYLLDWGKEGHYSTRTTNIELFQAIFMRLKKINVFTGSIQFYIHIYHIYYLPYKICNFYLQYLKFWTMIIKRVNETVQRNLSFIYVKHYEINDQIPIISLLVFVSLL